ncbi:hypothetical protein HPB48_011300 [Haemaphysalis longicornis]|uniref:Uncharacterized protein n=1 Tax=Haemaphysalis longicornis TaxID=44386 RepID=A0A9J6GWT7_HAELO|nr:hypothetical protein HPB48_011300 [Haemaphysalis longicornis]
MIECLGPIEFNHVWMAAFSSDNDMETLSAQTEIIVKEKRCLVLNLNKREVTAKVQWLPPNVPDGLIV